MTRTSRRAAIPSRRPAPAPGGTRLTGGPSRRSSKGRAPIPPSMLVCDNGGMVVICAGTTGFSAMVDLRYLWMRQKRLQGSHFANDEQAAAFNRMVIDGKIDPCVSRVFSFEEIPEAHQLMYENRHPEGNMVAWVSAPREGLKDL